MKTKVQKTYWNSQGKHQTAYDKLKNLVPDSGPADTHEGEILRAVSKIYYRYYNDGDSVRMKGGAVQSACTFLQRSDLPVGISRTIEELRVAHNRQEYERHLEKLTSKIVVWIKAKKGKYVENKDDYLQY